MELQQTLYQVFSFLDRVKEYPNREKTILAIHIFWSRENLMLVIIDTHFNQLFVTQIGDAHLKNQKQIH